MSDSFYNVGWKATVHMIVSMFGGSAKIGAEVLLT
jgi:hypothetical protein